MLEVGVGVCDLIVMRDAGNKLFEIGGEHVSGALRLLTGLQSQNLGGTCLTCCFDEGVEGGRECLFSGLCFLLSFFPI